jgi:hypothetical protein
MSDKDDRLASLRTGVLLDNGGANGAAAEVSVDLGGDPGFGEGLCHRIETGRKHAHETANKIDLGRCGGCLACRFSARRTCQRGQNQGCQQPDCGPSRAGMRSCGKNADRHNPSQASTSPSADSNRARPSLPPCAGSIRFSGCGIMPSTLPALLTMPAMLLSEPFGIGVGGVAKGNLVAGFDLGERRRNR